MPRAQNGKLKQTLLNSLENDAGLWEVGILADLIPEMIQTILTLFVSQ